MRLFCKYKVGDKVLIKHQNKTRVGHIVRRFHPGNYQHLGYKYVTIGETNGTWYLDYRFHKKNIIKRLK